MATKLEIIKQNGGIPRPLAGQDHISGLMFYIADEHLPTPDIDVTDGFSTTNRIIPVSTIERAEELGLKADSDVWVQRLINYHLRECFRMNPGISLYVGLFAPPTGTYDFVEIKAMQNFADGNLRQIGVWAGGKVIASADIISLQSIATLLEADAMPLSIVYSPKVADITSVANVTGIGNRNVSVVIGQDGEGVANDLFVDADNTTNKDAVGIIGLTIGALSAAKVSESIAWVERFPTGIALPAFVDGKVYRNVDKAIIETLDTKSYIYLKKYPGISGSYFSDSNTMDLTTSDYAFIENERTMDKAIRGIRVYLSPYIAAPLLVDKETGKLRPDVVLTLKNVAGTTLSQMELAEELSGYLVDIDPNQNVVATATVEFVVKNVPVGVMRTIRVKIGYATSIN